MVSLELLSHHMQKDSSVVHSPYDIMYIYSTVLIKNISSRQTRAVHP